MQRIQNVLFYFCKSIYFNKSFKNQFKSFVISLSFVLVYSLKNLKGIIYNFCALVENAFIKIFGCILSEKVSHLFIKINNVSEKDFY